jgi:hypothetical protein
VARNPALTRELALALLETYPADASHNPALPLWLLEQPDLLRLRPRTIPALLSIDPPAWLLSVLQDQWNEHSSERTDVLLGKWLARRPDTPAWLLTRLCACGHPGTRYLASRNPEVPYKTLALLQAAGSDPDLRLPVRRRPPASSTQLREAAALGVWGAQLVASHPRAPEELLAELARHPSPAVTETLARHPRRAAQAPPPGPAARLTQGAQRLASWK